MKKLNVSSAQLDSDLLRSFLVLAQEGNISRGATRLLRTQSAVTLQLQRLEDIVGQALFHRHARGVTLAPAGEKLLPVAREVVASLDRVTLELRGKAPAGTIRIGIPDEYGDAFLVDILARFADQHPTVHVEVRCSSSVTFPDDIAAGRLDLALHSPESPAPPTRKTPARKSPARPSPARKAPARQTPATSTPGRVVHRERAVWVGSAYVELIHRRPLPVALFDKDCWWRARTIDMLRRSGLDFHIACSSESMAGVRAAVVSGIAVGVLPHSTVTPDLRELHRAGLPSLGHSPVVLSQSPNAPADLATAMSTIIIQTFRTRRPIATG